MIKERSQLNELKDKSGTVHPLSYSQRALWFLEQTAPRAGVYHIGLAFKIVSTLDMDALKRVWEQLARRHALLRATFPQIDGEPVCRVSAEGSDAVDFAEIEASNLNEVGLRREVKRVYLQPFALEREPAYRVRLFRRAPDEVVLLLATHHLISDGLSLVNLMSEMMLLYANETGYFVEPKKIPDLKLDYFAHVANQKTLVADERGARMLDYWREQLAGELPVLNLPTDKPKSPVQTLNGGSHTVRLSTELSALVRSYARQEKVATNAVLLAAFKALLNRYAGQEDIIVGVPALGRKKTGFLRVLGDFTNTVAIRTTVAGHALFEDYLRQVQRQLDGAMANQEYPFSLVVADLNPSRAAGNAPVLQAMFVLQSLRHNEKIQALLVPTREDARVAWHGLELEPFELPLQEGEHEFALEVWEGKDDFLCIFKFNTDLFEAPTIERMARHFITLLSGLLREPQKELRSHVLLSDDERARLLYEFNAAENLYDGRDTIVDVFEQQATRTPDHTALVFGDKHTSYRSLSEQSDQFAHHLRENHDVRAGEIVGLLLERSEKMIVAILAVLKAGGIYLPLDPQSPADRLAYILEDSEVKRVLTDGGGERASLPPGVAQINVADERIYERPVPRVASPATADDVAYIIYTSGTTGYPKGCRITHGNVVMLFKNSQRLFRFDAKDVWVMAHSYTFDFSVWEMYGALFHGGSLVVPSHEEVQDPSKLWTLVQRHRVSVLNQTPGAFYHFIEEELKRGETAGVETPLRCVIFGGDKLEAGRLARWVARHPLERVQLVNMYGITETTVHVTYHRLTAADISKGGSPIGRGLPGVELYILDEGRQPVPLGVTGELFVGGTGVSKGYLKRPELTAERFVANPFEPSRRLYKSGDLGRWLPDGTVEYVGRNDDQVKIRGFRIETGEIESHLSSHRAVKEAVVVARRDEGSNQYLAAYVVATEPLTESGLRAYLRERVPDYMIPSRFVQMETLPLTSNNKIDRKNLPDPESQEASGEASHVAPRNVLERDLERIWRAVLNRRTVSVTDNFFDIGGHSLKAIHLIAQLHKELGIKLELLELFTHTSIEALARLIKQKQTQAYHSIKPLAERPFYDVSHAQRRLWVLSQIGDGLMAYNISVAYELDGLLDARAFTRALETVVARHESLRTVFVEHEGVPVQLIRAPEDAGFVFEVLDLRAASDADAAASELMDAEARTPFDLSRGPLLRAKLARMDERRSLFLFTMHHIISDGLSIGVLVREVLSLYDAYRRGQDDPLAPLPIQYKDYAAWQNELLAGGAYDAQRDFWLEELEGELPTLDLPTDYLRPKVKTFHGERYHHEFAAPVSRSVQAFCREHGFTLFQGLFACVNVLLHRYTGQTDLVVGVPVAGRTHADLVDQIGFYVNTLALRTRLAADDTFVELLGRVREKTIRAFENQDYSFDRLVEELPLSHDLSRSTLFDVMVVVQNADIDIEKAFDERGVTLKPLVTAHAISKFDLTFEFTETAHDGLQVAIEYNSDLFTRGRIERAAVHLENLLKSLSEDSACRIGEASYLSAEEGRQLLSEFNATDVELPAGQTMHELYEAQAARTPDAPAVRFENLTLTYRELNERANQLAHHLRKTFRLAPDSLVGIMLERSERMVIAVLGVLKAGAAYVPIDPAYPKERIRFMLEDASAGALLVDDRMSVEDFEWPASRCVSLVADWPQISLESKENPERAGGPENLAYVIYTSGSTGQPKGALIEHRNAVNLYHDQSRRFAYCEHDRILQFASLSFDASVYEISVALFSGATLVLVSRETIGDTDAFTSYVAENDVSVMVLPPPFLNTLDPARLRGLRLLLTGGDAPNAAQASACSSFTTYCNAYGPTECAVLVSTYCVTEQDARRTTIPIGRPIANTQFYITDERMNLQPVGVAGELCVGGAGVGRGYLDRPELTAERFVPNHFKGSGRLYRTGDLCRWLPDGNVEFLGRRDAQVKVRGFRIEPGEIEQALLAQEKIMGAAVVPREDHQGLHLVAYVAAAEPLSIPAVKASLQTKLPDYMMPSYFVQLDQLPVTPSGKIDRRALPSPSGAHGDADAIASVPSNNLQRHLVAIWEDILNVEHVGVQDKFFDLGGHSLNATQLVARIHKELGVKVGLQDVFLNPTVESLANLIAGVKHALYEPIQQAAAQDFYPLSPSQRSLWLLSQTDDGSVAYNMPGAFMLEGELDAAAFEASFRTLISRHESLRTTFVMVDGEPRQQVHPATEIGFEWETPDVRAAADPASAVDELARAEAQTPFDLEKGPLVRAKLVRVDKERHVFLFNIHHIIGDGWSASVLVNEVLLLYHAYRSGHENPLAPLRIQYKDYVVWQSAQLDGEQMRHDRDYWLAQFAGGVPRLKLPTDFSRPAKATYAGGSINARLDDELLRRLYELGKRRDASLFMILLAAIYALLYRYSGQDDIVLGSPVAGRNHYDLEDQVGLYVNTLALRTRFSGGESGAQLLERVKATMLDAYRHQAYPFARLVEDLDASGGRGASPLFNVFVTFQNKGNALLDLRRFDGLTVRPVEVESAVSKFDLSFDFSESASGVALGLSYNSALIEEATALLMFEKLKLALAIIAADEGQSIDDFDLDTEMEKDLIEADGFLELNF